MTGGRLLEVTDLAVHFPRRRGLRRLPPLQAVEGVDLTLDRGETLGLVGESGCGKSTTGLALLRLVEPTRGRVVFDGEDVTTLPRRELRALRRRIAMIFQDPFASLNPRQTIGQSIAEPLEVHGLADDATQRRRRVSELLELVGLRPEVEGRYPHEFSGGQRQRVGIARALAGEPDFIVCDEPIASLDVSIQAQILNLLERLQAELGVAYLFIAHDLAAVGHLAHRIAVMYLGRVVEVADRDGIAADPQHPYTRALVSAIPVPDPVRERSRERIVLAGDLPSPSDPPSGCRFRTRCPESFDDCAAIEPALQRVEGAHAAACLLHGLEGTRVAPSAHPSRHEVGEETSSDR